MGKLHNKGDHEVLEKKQKIEIIEKRKVEHAPRF
jgi:hypothetical protein